MVQTKEVELSIDWLEEIAGRTVASAIEYLQSLDPTHRLEYDMEGDTHGCSVVSTVYYKVDLTQAEIFAKLERHYLRQIGFYAAAREHHVKDNSPGRIANCDRLIAQLNLKYEEAKSKYGY